MKPALILIVLKLNALRNVKVWCADDCGITLVKKMLSNGYKAQGQEQPSSKCFPKS